MTNREDYARMAHLLHMMAQQAGQNPPNYARIQFLNTDTLGAMTLEPEHMHIIMRALLNEQQRLSGLNVGSGEIYDLIQKLHNTALKSK